MIARLAGLSVLVLSLGSVEAQQLPAVYIEGIGATSLYSVGLEQVLVRSAEDERRLSLRIGAGYWVGKAPLVVAADEAILRAPVSVLASFALGEPLGVPMRFEAGGGVVFSYAVTDLTGLNEPGAVERVDLDVPPFTELALRVNPSRQFSVRGGFVLGGKADDFLSSDLAPLLSVGYGF